MAVDERRVFKFPQGEQAESALRREASILAAESRLGASGRILVRISGTEPLIRVMGEGDDADLVAAAVGDIVEAIGKAAA